MQRLFRFVSFFLSAAALAFFLGHGIPASSEEVNAQALEQITKSIQLCLPKAPEDAASPYQFALLGSQKIGDQTFHLLLVKDPADPNDYPWETLIVTAGINCKNLIPVRSDVQTLTRFVPQPVAQQLALARYNELQKTPAGERLIQRQLKAITVPVGSPTDVDMDELLIAPEDAWALRQLGISVPSSFKISPVETPTK